MFKSLLVINVSLVFNLKLNLLHLILAILQYILNIEKWP